jgi:seryl-tRNA synthetase
MNLDDVIESGESDNTEPKEETEQAQPEPVVVPDEPGEGAKILERLLEADKRSRAAREEAASKDAELRELKAQLEQMKAAKAEPKADVPAPIKSVMDEVGQIKELLTKREREEQEREQVAALTTAQQSVRNYVDGNKDKFPLLVAMGWEDEVFHRMVAHHQTGNRVSEAQAAREIEESLAARLDQLAQVEAIRNKIAQSNGGQGETGKKRSSKTLSSQVSGTSPSKGRVLDELDDDEALLELERRIVALSR